MSRSHARRLRRAIIIAGVIIGSAALLTPTAGADDQATVYIVQGLPGLTATVAIDGRTVFADAGPGKISDPIKIDSGKVTVSVTVDGGTVLTSETTLAAGSNSDLAVHLPIVPKGDPVLTVFDNDLTAVPRGKAGLAVAHVGIEPPADVMVNDKVIFANVTNGDFVYTVVPAGTYQVKCVAAGHAQMKMPALMGPVELTVQGGTLTRVFAYGDPAAGMMTYTSHAIKLASAGSDRPQDVNTGTGGQAAWSAVR
ncbi:DUF4397 domain-containing protein [Microlunatus speluncae]|uniref:DUF4397 domain-containing protein n=1 Tax=Microlunatus speluncae TaxID=2594267 RepID=UPI0012667766|nr:DUF4397 domain-containing protein [Microlunatus speluncae]